MLVVNGWKLVTLTGREVCAGDTVPDFRGEKAILESGRPPHKPASSGFVSTDSGEFYPGVYGLKWVKLSVKVGNAQ